MKFIIEKMVCRNLGSISDNGCEILEERIMNFFQDVNRSYGQEVIFELVLRVSGMGKMSLKGMRSIMVRENKGQFYEVKVVFILRGF